MPIRSMSLTEVLVYVARVVGSEEQAKCELTTVLKRGGERIYAMSERTIILGRVCKL
jgi:hypothetical protein